MCKYVYVYVYVYVCVCVSMCKYVFHVYVLGQFYAEVIT